MLIKNPTTARPWWHRPLITALRPRQEDLCERPALSTGKVPELHKDTLLQNIPSHPLP